MSRDQRTTFGDAISILGVAGAVTALFFPWLSYTIKDCTAPSSDPSYCTPYLENAFEAVATNMVCVFATLSALCYLIFVLRRPMHISMPAGWIIGLFSGILLVLWTLVDLWVIHDQFSRDTNFTWSLSVGWYLAMVSAVVVLVGAAFSKFALTLVISRAGVPVRGNPSPPDPTTSL